MPQIQSLLNSIMVTAAENGEAAQAAGEGAAKSAPLPPNFVALLYQWMPDFFLFAWMHKYEKLVYVVISIGVIAWFFSRASKQASVRPNRFQALVEMLLETLLNLVEDILGKQEARRYFPFLASLFIFILFMNLLGLIPLLESPTGSIFITAPLAFCVFLYVQYTALVRLGPAKYFHHLMGEPNDAVGWILVPLFLPLHIVEELIKPVSLSARLFGNVYGKEILLGVMIMLGVGMVQAFWPESFLGIPLHLPFMFLAILLSIIQALVFFLLATVYVSMVLPHDEHEHGEAH